MMDSWGVSSREGKDIVSEGDTNNDFVVLFDRVKYIVLMKRKRYSNILTIVWTTIGTIRHHSKLLTNRPNLFIYSRNITGLLQISLCPRFSTHQGSLRQSSGTLAYNAIPCSMGTSTSFFPWIIKTGQDTF